MSKYANRKTEVNGILFDSRKEAGRFRELCWLRNSGAISDLKLQVPYELVPAQKVNGKTVERAVKYIADFVYTENGKTVVEDAKGYRTEVYKIKKKLMLWKYGIQIKEV